MPFEFRNKADDIVDALVVGAVDDDDRIDYGVYFDVDERHAAFAEPEARSRLLEDDSSHSTSQETLRNSCRVTSSSP